MKASIFSGFFQAITTPSMAVSHIMLESYKKYILVALMLHGKVRVFSASFPRVAWWTGLNSVCSAVVTSLFCPFLRFRICRNTHLRLLDAT